MTLQEEAQAVLREERREEDVQYMKKLLTLLDEGKRHVVSLERDVERYEELNGKR